MLSETIDDLSVFSSTIPAGREQKRTAQTVVIALIITFLFAAPFARHVLAPVWAFIPAYETVIATNYLITAVLLFGYFRHAGSRDHYILACGFLLTGFLAIAHELSFPGLFAATGLLGDHTQTSPWLYMFWHASLPISVIVYAAMKDGEGLAPPRQWRPRYAVLVAIAAALALAALIVTLTTFLPEIAPASRDVTLMTVVVSDVLGLGLFALAILWLRRPYFVLDLWVMVVMCASICEVALSAALNAGRFDLGFYIGCAFGLVASAVMIMALPLENGRLYERLKESAAELGRLATTDPLTGVANRRAFEKALDAEWRRAARRRIPLSLALIDVDYFKNYNDFYGHPAGDQCLKAVATALDNYTRRAGEMTARYGGEEFAVLLPHMEAGEARRLCERICDAVAALNIPHSKSGFGHVSVSVGVATMSNEIAEAISAHGVAGPLGVAATKLIEAADKALYAAKGMGRNRVCAFAALSDEAIEQTGALPKAAE